MRRIIITLLLLITLSSIQAQVYQTYNIIFREYFNDAPDVIRDVSMHPLELPVRIDVKLSVNESGKIVIPMDEQSLLNVDVKVTEIFVEDNTTFIVLDAFKDFNIVVITMKGNRMDMNMYKFYPDDLPTMIISYLIEM